MVGNNEMIIAIAAGIGILYGSWLLPKKISWVRSLFKTLPIAILAFGAMNAWVFEQGPWLLVLALALSALGDCCLSREGEVMFLGGLGAFLAGHLAYIALFVTSSSVAFEIGALVLLVTIVTIVLVIVVLKNLWRHLGELRPGVIAYTIVIAAMVISAFATGQNNLLLYGVSLFAFSDAVLAHEMFVLKNPSYRKIAAYSVWASYLAAQIMIVIAILHY